MNDDDVERQHHVTFKSLCRVDEDGRECQLARDPMPVLEYATSDKHPNNQAAVEPGRFTASPAAQGGLRWSGPGGRIEPDQVAVFSRNGRRDSPEYASSGAPAVAAGPTRECRNP